MIGRTQNILNVPVFVLIYHRLHNALQVITPAIGQLFSQPVHELLPGAGYIAGSKPLAEQFPGGIGQQTPVKEPSVNDDQLLHPLREPGCHVDGYVPAPGMA